MQEEEKVEYRGTWLYIAWLHYCKKGIYQGKLVVQSLGNESSEKSKNVFKSIFLQSF